jgi:hypothetical protein
MAAEIIPVEPDPDNAGVGKLITLVSYSSPGVFR